MKAYYPSYFLLSVDGQVQTRQVQGSYDDSYLGESKRASALRDVRGRLQTLRFGVCLAGYSVAAGEFGGDDEEGEARIYSTGEPARTSGSRVW